MKKQLIFTLLLVGFLLISSADAGLAIFRSSGNGVDDNTFVADIFSRVRTGKPDYPDSTRNYGNENRNYSNRFLVGTDSDSSDRIYRGLLGYDISDIPENATIESVTLTLTTCRNSSEDDANITFNVYELASGDLVQGLTEASEYGGIGPSWNYRDVPTYPDADGNGIPDTYDTTGFTDPGVAWTTAGGDFDETTVLSSVTVDLTDYQNTGTTMTFGSSSNFVAQAQAALDSDDILNLILTCPTAEETSVKAFVYFCNDMPNETYPYVDVDYPTLTITYSVVPEPSTLVLLGSLLVGAFLVWRRK